jgi:sterol desaturase/sphingolipid hydroxylase (fatty acid hydroxylase superfamily)
MSFSNNYKPLAMPLFQTQLQDFISLFGAVRIPADQLRHLEKSAPNLMVYALPAVLAFTVIEVLLSHFGDHRHYEKKETIGSVLIGLGNLTVNLLMKMTLLYGALWIYNALPWRMELNWWTLGVCFVAYDCCSYWSHRISHFNRFFWATHVVHHSAEHYNLTVAFRQSWVQHLKTVFFIPVALMGFHPEIFFVASQMSTLYQFWVHTETIGKLHPFIEKYFGTPSNHRVHHGSQEKYLDKNFGATFMIWDHLFGTFQYEEEKPVYGLTTRLENKTNPFVLNFHEYRDMLHDIKHSDGLRELLFFIFASPARIYRHKTERSVRQMNEAIGKLQAPAEQPKFLPLRFSDEKSRRMLKLGGIVLLIVALLSETGLAQPIHPLPTPRTENMLFFLQRDPDANTVIFELNYGGDGKLDPRNPVKGSWIRYSEDGKSRELTGIENKFAYGVKCKALGNEEFEIRLVAYKKMPLYLKRCEEDNKYKIYIKDEGKDYLLKRVFVRVKGGSFWLPRVEYIDLITVNSISGIEFLKRINI